MCVCVCGCACEQQAVVMATRLRMSEFPRGCAHAQFVACLLIFTSANVLGTLLSKAMASHFHKEAHFSKMQDAIRKVSNGPCMTWLKEAERDCCHEVPDQGPRQADATLQPPDYHLLLERGLKHGAYKGDLVDIRRSTGCRCWPRRVQDRWWPRWTTTVTTAWPARAGHSTRASSTSALCAPPDLCLSQPLLPSHSGPARAPPVNEITNHVLT